MKEILAIQSIVHERRRENPLQWLKSESKQEQSLSSTINLKKGDLNKQQFKLRLCFSNNSKHKTNVIIQT